MALTKQSETIANLSEAKALKKAFCLSKVS